MGRRRKSARELSNQPASPAQGDRGDGVQPRTDVEASTEAPSPEAEIETPEPATEVEPDTASSDGEATANVEAKMPDTPTAEAEAKTDIPTAEAEAEAAETPDVPDSEVDAKTDTPAAEADAEAPDGPSAEPVVDAADIDSDAAERSPAAETTVGAESNWETAVATSTGPGPGTLPDWWTSAYPQVTSVTAATAYLDALGGAMSRREQNGRWILSTGEQVLYEANTSEELDGFVLGFALSQLIAERHGPIAHARRN